MENINGKMDKFTKDNGLMDSKMDLVYGEDQKVILILDNGKTEKLMVMEFILG